MRLKTYRTKTTLPTHSHSMLVPLRLLLQPPTLRSKRYYLFVFLPRASRSPTPALFGSASCSAGCATPLAGMHSHKCDGGTTAASRATRRNIAVAIPLAFNKRLQQDMRSTTLRDYDMATHTRRAATTVQARCASSLAARRVSAAAASAWNPSQATAASAWNRNPTSCTKGDMYTANFIHTSRTQTNHTAPRNINIRTISPTLLPPPIARVVL